MLKAASSSSWRAEASATDADTAPAPGSDTAADAVVEHHSGETSEHVHRWLAGVTRSTAGGRGAEAGGEAYVERGATSLATIAEGRHSISRRGLFNMYMYVSALASAHTLFSLSSSLISTLVL